MASLATSRVRVAGLSRGRKGHLRSEEGERAMAILVLRRQLGGPDIEMSGPVASRLP